MNIGLRLKEMRLRSGLSQRDLARRSGIGYRSISLWEGVRSGRIRLEHLDRLCRACGITVAHFFAFDLEGDGLEIPPERFAEQIGYRVEWEDDSAFLISKSERAAGQRLAER